MRPENWKLNKWFINLSFYKGITKLEFGVLPSSVFFVRNKDIV